MKELYNLLAFFTHLVLLDQAVAHCPIFLTAAFKKSLGRVSVPMWLIILSNQLKIVGLVSLLNYQLPNLPQTHPLAFFKLYFLFRIFIK